MKIILADLEPKQIKAWNEFFLNEEDVNIVECDITSLICDAVVSPANSFECIRLIKKLY